MDVRPKWIRSRKPIDLASGLLCGSVPPMRPFAACVGLIVIIGCFVMVIAPDDILGFGSGWFSSTMPTVVIDAGHGGNDDGARCKGVHEKTLTLDVAIRVERFLRELGYRTVMTRKDDRYVSLADRVSIANAVEGPAVFVSIHFNQGNGRDINGIETFYASVKTPPASDWTWVGLFSRPATLDTGENLAEAVQSAVIEKTGARDRGIRPRSLYVTRNTRIPAILTEGGFITNPMEARLLREEFYADRLAHGIADGVDAWWHTQPLRRPRPSLVKQ